MDIHKNARLTPHSRAELVRCVLAEIPAAPGAYLLIVELARPLPVQLPRRAPALLAAGRYAYCGSARGPGGLRARLARHLRRDKACHWHIDRLTAAGRVIELLAAPAADECALRALVQRQAGVTVPLPGFGSSDCRLCPSHLLYLPRGIDIADSACRTVGEMTVVL